MIFLDIFLAQLQIKKENPIFFLPSYKPYRVEEVKRKLHRLALALIHSIRVQCCAQWSVKQFRFHQTSVIHIKDLDESDNLAQLYCGYSKHAPCFALRSLSFFGADTHLQTPASGGGGSKLSHYLCIGIIAIHVCAWNGAPSEQSSGGHDKLCVRSRPGEAFICL